MLRAARGTINEFWAMTVVRRPSCACALPLPMANRPSEHHGLACQLARAAGQYQGPRRVISRCGRSTSRRAWRPSCSTSQITCILFPRDAPSSDCTWRVLLQGSWGGEGCKRPFIVSACRQASSCSRQTAIYWRGTISDDPRRGPVPDGHKMRRMALRNTTELMALCLLLFPLTESDVRTRGWPWPLQRQKMRRGGRRS